MFSNNPKTPNERDETDQQKASKWLAGDLLVINHFGGPLTNAHLDGSNPNTYPSNTIKAKTKVIYLGAVKNFTAEDGYWYTQGICVKVLFGEIICWIPVRKCNLVTQGKKMITG